MAAESDSKSLSTSCSSTSSSSTSSSSEEDEEPAPDDDVDVAPAEASPDDGDDAIHDVIQSINDDGDARKAFLSRIPQSFDSDSIIRIFEMTYGPGCLSGVSIMADADDDDDDDVNNDRRGRDGRDKNNDQRKQHRGYGFVTFASTSCHVRALSDGTVRGSARPNSNRRHTMYVMPIVRDDDGGKRGRDGGEKKKTNRNDDGIIVDGTRNICFPWTRHRCPYGDGCKFVHAGEGGCIPTVDAGATAKRRGRSRGGKKDGENDGGKGARTATGTSNDGVGGAKEEREKEKDRSRIDCINYRNKGKCRRMSTCPYRHDPSALRGKSRARAMRTGDASVDDDAKEDKGDGEGGGGGAGVRDNGDDVETRKGGGRGSADNVKVRQSLSIRVFGLNYDTTEKDVRDFFANCGRIMEVTFPLWEDSGRSKGYCGVLFTSPRAVMKAIELDGMELHGRWLRVQEGKMYLRRWEEAERNNDSRRYHDDDGGGRGGGSGGGGGAPGENAKKLDEPLVGEYGQRVKRRKKHGYKE
jgi:RNA recognition motif-containing protein